jgi:lysophospholipase L1-like esterase
MSIAAVILVAGPSLLAALDAEEKEKEQPAARPAWIDAMRKVHARFRGEKGTFACFGDSITVSMAFWASLRDGGKNMSPDAKKDFDLVKGRMKPECWAGWKGPEHGNQGSMTIRWALDNIDSWLEKLQPEVALILFGTNDLNSVPLEEYEKATREVVKRCLEKGTVVILSTIPPRSGMLEKSREYAAAAARVAKDLEVPLCDYFAECLRRRPDDWDGAAKKFEAHEGYEVPTLISRDGVHPSNPRKHAGDYSDEGLSRNGFVLRNWLALRSYAEVIREALEPRAR